MYVRSHFGSSKMPRINLVLPPGWRVFCGVPPVPMVPLAADADTTSTAVADKGTFKGNSGEGKGSSSTGKNDDSAGSSTHKGLFKGKNKGKLPPWPPEPALQPTRACSADNIDKGLFKGKHNGLFHGKPSGIATQDGDKGLGKGSDIAVQDPYSDLAVQNPYSDIAVQDGTDIAVQDPYSDLGVQDPYSDLGTDSDLGPDSDDSSPSPAIIGKGGSQNPFSSGLFKGKGEEVKGAQNNIGKGGSQNLYLQAGKSLFEGKGEEVKGKHMGKHMGKGEEVKGKHMGKHMGNGNRSRSPCRKGEVGKGYRFQSWGWGG
jgi:hypothetical protein